MFAQANDKIYYDAFYEEYYNSFPNKKPNLIKNVKNTNNSENVYKIKRDYKKSNKKNEFDTSDRSYKLPSNWESIYYNEAMRYWEYKTSDIRFDVAYQKISSQFEFEMMVGSILKWDRLNGGQIKALLSKDFYIANKQYSGNFEYKSGNVSSDYTLDDDLWNELHIFSAGRGNGKLSDMKMSIGMRNLFRFYGWNITPGFGIQKKDSNLKMLGHGQPVPFFVNCGADKDICEIPNMRDSGGNIFTGYVENGALIPEGDMEVNDAENLTGNNHTVLFNATDYTNWFNGYSSVNKIDGVSHYYNAGWFGPFASVDLEKIISIRESLLFRIELFYPKYKAHGIWPQRKEWKDFYDQGGQSIGYSLSAIYTMKVTPSVGLYGALTTDYIISRGMDTKINFANGDTEINKKEIKRAEWKSTIVELGLKYLF